MCLKYIHKRYDEPKEMIGYKVVIDTVQWSTYKTPVYDFLLKVGESYKTQGFWARLFRNKPKMISAPEYRHGLGDKYPTGFHLYALKSQAERISRGGIVLKCRAKVHTVGFETHYVVAEYSSDVRVLIADEIKVLARVN